MKISYCSQIPCKPYVKVECPKSSLEFIDSYLRPRPCSKVRYWCINARGDIIAEDVYYFETESEAVAKARQLMDEGKMPVHLVQERSAV